MKALFAHARRLAGRALGAATPLVLARLLSAVLTVCLPLVLARKLSPSAYGTFKQFFLVALTALSIMQLGMSQSLYYFLPRRDDRDRASFLTQTAILLAAVGAVSAVVLYATAPRIGAVVGDGSLVGLRLPLALYAALMLASCALEPALTATGRITASAVALVATDAVRAVALLVAVTCFSPAALFWAAVLVAAVRVAALWLLVLTGVLPAQRPSLRAWRRQLVYALPFGGAMIFYIAQRYCAQYLVAARFDTATFALFTIAAFHLPILTIVFTSTSEVLMVQMARSMPTEPRRALAEWQDAVGKLAFILFPVACVSWLVAGTLVPLLFTSRYAGAVPLFILTTFEIPIWIVPTDALLRTGNDTRFLFSFNIARIFITVGLVLVGMRFFAMGGAIVGTIASEAIARAVFLARGRRFLAATWREVLHLDAIGTIAAACAIASAAAWASSRLFERPIARVCLPAMLFVGAYLATMAIAGRKHVQLARPRPLGSAA